ncbi:potassium transporter TrkA [Halobaculum marinum]|uniref:Potassium transporter TrkA n=1 Tax=Halobaculum marinum TaxID=3031996 RepID=A0ABD5WXS1_9EURY|nr:potassium transporter TrkA [Halobaculum sp. DT55]
MSPFVAGGGPVAALPLQSVVDVIELLNVPRLVGFAFASFLVAAAGAATYRWYVGEVVPRGLPTLLGTATVAVYLNTVGLFSTVIPVDGLAAADPFAPATVLRNVVSLLVAIAAAPVGRRVGDRFATNVTAVAGADRVEGELSRFARTVGRIRTVEVPDDVADIDGYDPVDDATKERLAGETLLFPRRLSEQQLRDRFVTRLKEEYGVGHVDAEFDGTKLVHLGVGRRVAGIGPTLGPGTCAVAVRADPPQGAGPGDAVQVWRRPAGTHSDATDAPDDAATVSPEADGGSAADSRFERVTTAELRAVVGDVVTLAVDESDTDVFDADGEYRLVTMPVSQRADREFASLLRVADETMAVVSVHADGELVGATVGDLPGAVAAVEAADGSVEPIPPRGRTLAVDETVYVVARPEAIRELERRATGAATDGGGDGEPDALT